MTTQELVDKYCGEKVINVQEEFGDPIVGENYQDLADCFDSNSDLHNFEPIPLKDYLKIDQYMHCYFWEIAIRKYLPEHSEEIINCHDEEL